MKKFIRTIRLPALFLLFALLLAFSLRGIPGNPSASDLQQKIWTDNGPFELSPERGRFALTYSILEDNSLFFSVPLARFVVPDLGFKNGNYVSLFAPGVSYIVIPGYVLGRLFGASQVGTVAIISLFALLNAYLIIAILRHLGVRTSIGVLSAMTFLFATPAFSYALTLYQHHISTLLILASLYVLVKWNTVWALSVFWFLFAASIPIDYPNLFLMIPLAVFAVSKTFHIVVRTQKIHIQSSLFRIITPAAACIPLVFFLWFNYASYGNPLQFSGTVATVKEIDESGKPTAPKEVNVLDREKYTNPDKQSKSATRFFKSRNLVNGFFIHVFSPDRGIVVFAPVLIFIFLSLRSSYRGHSSAVTLIVTIMLINVLLYSMWGDPWGGWAFGSRYLIPSYGLGAILIGLSINSFRYQTFALVLYMAIFAYSSVANTAGALTSIANPPRVEVLNLEKITGRVQKFTYLRNIEMLSNGSSKSLAFSQLFSKYIDSWQYFQIISGFIIVLGSTTALYICLTDKRNT